MCHGWYPQIMFLRVLFVWCINFRTFIVSLVTGSMILTVPYDINYQWLIISPSIDDYDISVSHCDSLLFHTFTVCISPNTARSVMAEINVMTLQCLWNCVTEKTCKLTWQWRSFINSDQKKRRFGGLAACLEPLRLRFPGEPLPLLRRLSARVRSGDSWSLHNTIGFDETDTIKLSTRDFRIAVFEGCNWWERLLNQNILYYQSINSSSIYTIIIDDKTISNQ